MSDVQSQSTEEPQHNQSEAITQLMAETPTNDFNLPVGIYRVDMLPWHLYEQATAKVVPLTEATQKRIAAPVVDVTPEPSKPLFVGDKEYHDELEALKEYDLDSVEELDSEVSAGDPAEGTEEPQETEVETKVIQHDFVQRLAGFPINALEPAFVWLDYTESVPTLPSGMPFWTQFDWETPDAFQAFQAYLQLGNVVPERDKANEHLRAPKEFDNVGVRSVSSLVQWLYPGANHVDLRLHVATVQEYAALYLWDTRAKAYDMFRAAQHQRQTELRAIETQDTQYLLAQKLWGKLEAYMEDDDLFWDMMTPKVAIDMLGKISAMQRINAGLPATGPLPESASSSNGGTGGSFEMTMRRIAQRTTQGSAEDDGEEGLLAIESQMTAAYEDEESLEMMQELIIKMNQPS